MAENLNVRICYVLVSVLDNGGTRIPANFALDWASMQEKLLKIKASGGKELCRAAMACLCATVKVSKEGY